MSEQPAEIRIETRLSLAIWPGDRAMCIRLEVSTLPADLMYVLDRDDRYMELAPYRLGMLGRR